MKVFETFLAGIDNPEHRDKMAEVLKWTANKFPNLERSIKWSIPMYSDHGTFIIGFSIAKYHFSVSPEPVAIKHFANEIKQSGYSSTNSLFRIPWNEQVNYELLKKIIEFNIQDKAECTTFWRK